MFQLRSQADTHVSCSACDADQLTAEQLESTVEQLRALSRTVELLHTQVRTSGALVINKPLGQGHVSDACVCVSDGPTRSRRG